MRHDGQGVRLLPALAVAVPAVFRSEVKRFAGGCRLDPNALRRWFFAQTFLTSH